VPHANNKDLSELPEEVRTGVTWHTVKTMDEVLALALRGTVPAIDEERVVMEMRAERMS
jgi:ATP-dependent Lon protease